MTADALAFLPHHETSTSDARDVRHHGEVSPTRDNQSRDRSTDATRLTFPLQLVITIVGIFISVVFGIWTATSSMNSKIDIIQQQLLDNAKLKETEIKLDEANRRLLEKSIDNIDKGVTAVKAQETLNTIEINNLKDRIVNLGAKK